MKASTTVDYPAAALILSRKTLLRNNILIGYDAAQLRLVEHILGIECKFVQGVVDLDLLGKEQALLLRVDNAKSIDISPATRTKTGIWTLHPIEKGSAAIGSIVRCAATLVGIDKLSAPILTQIGNEITRNEVEDVRGSIWTAVELLLEDLPEGKRWPDPWEQLSGWIPLGVDLNYRLNTLYQTLVAYVFSREMDDTNARKLGIKASKYLVLKKLNLDSQKVYDTLKELSIWRNQKTENYIIALKITKIWT